jgi:hypothetical protein
MLWSALSSELSTKNPICLPTPPAFSRFATIGRGRGHIHRSTITPPTRFLPAADKLVLSAVVQLPAASRWLVESLLSSFLVSKTNIMAVSGSS